MTKIGRIVSTVVALLAVMASNSYAQDLAHVYQQALLSDPVFQKAQADWLVAKQNFPLALTGNGVAGTGLFPNIAIAGALNNVKEAQTNYLGNNSGTYGNNGYSITVTQPLFNLPTWYSISSASYVVKSATAQYLAAAQELMRRVAFAYFEVLRANDKLLLTLAQKEQFMHQLVTSEEKFKVGLIAITGVYDAQASYDRSVADEIKDRNDLQDRLEDLRAITGIHYRSLAKLNAKIPLVIPSPRNIDLWVAIALRQNYLIQADLNAMLSSRENVKVAASAIVPTLNFVGSYSDVWEGAIRQPPLRDIIPITRTKLGSVGVSLSFPVLRGGYDIVNTRQARYQYLSSSDKLAIDHRVVENNTRQAFLEIDSGISQIRADEQAIISARNQLEATKAGYIVGTRTMVDVLDSVTSLTQTQLSYADDRYNYVEGIFALKDQAGTLSSKDVNAINNWLGKQVRFSLRQPDVKRRKTPYQKEIEFKGDLLEVNKPSLTDPIHGGAEKPSQAPSTQVPLLTPEKKSDDSTDNPASRMIKIPSSIVDETLDSLKESLKQVEKPSSAPANAPQKQKESATTKIEKSPPAKSHSTQKKDSKKNALEQLLHEGRAQPIKLPVKHRRVVVRQEVRHTTHQAVLNSLRASNTAASHDVIGILQLPEPTETHKPAPSHF